MKRIIITCFCLLCLLNFFGCDWITQKVDVPSNLDLLNSSSTTVTLTWTGSPTSYSYNVYYCSEDNKELISCSNVYYTNYYIESLEPETKYCFWVTALNKNKEETDPSDVLLVKTKYSGPTGLKVTEVKTNSMKLEWDSIENASSYRLWYHSNNIYPLAHKESEINSYTISELTPNTDYFFYLTAIIDGEETEDSSCIKQTTLSTSEFSYKLYDLDIDGSDNSIKIENPNGTEIFILKTNPSARAINASQTRYVTFGIPSASYRQVSDNNEVLPVFTADATFVTEDGSTITRKEHKGALEWRQNPELALEALNSSMNADTSSRSITSVNRVAIGDTRDFWMDNDDGTFYTENATLKVEGTYCYVWICNDYYSDNSPSIKNDNKLTLTQLKNIATTFDKLYQLETLVFGSKYETQSSGYIAPNDKISIYITDISKDYSFNQASGIFGYFWSKDFIPDSNGSNGSNALEVIYMDSFFIDRYEKIAFSTLGHEFQHLLNFVHHLYTTSSNIGVETWFNEMLSMLAEDMLIDKLDLDANTDGPQTRLYDFVSGYFYSGITDWLSNDDVLYSYAGAYAFGAFLVRNYGGIELLQAIASSDYSNWEAIIEAVNKVNSLSVTESDLLREFGRALVYTNPTEGDIPSFNKKATGKLSNENKEEFVYTFYPIDLNNFSFNYQNQVYYGPAVFEATKGGYELRPFGLSLHYYGNTAGSVEIHFSSKKNNSEKVYVIVQ